MRIFLAAPLAFILSFFSIFVSPSSAATTAAGDILVADPGSGTIRHYSASGVDLGVFASGLSSPSWITADRIGNIYVSEYEGKRISQFSPAGANLLTITTPYKPGGVRVGTDGTIYVAEYSTGKVYLYSATGADLGLFASTALLLADFMAFDAGGNLYVTDSFREVVGRVSPTGVDLGDFVAGFPGAAGIAFDADGNLYVASFNNNIVEKYSASGTDLGTFASMGLSASITGIAFDASGNLYVANFAEGTIHKFSSAGLEVGVFASTGLVDYHPRDLVIVPVGATPTVKEECKQDGWQSFGSFTNQGDCIQLLNTGK
jgi:DNA-binding beta-propeller fold protein YncE